MKSMEIPEQHNHPELDLGLSIGGTFRNLPHNSTASVSSFTLLGSDGDEEEESGVTDAKNRPDKKRQNRATSFASVQGEEEDEESNRPLKREKRQLGEGVGSQCDLIINSNNVHPAPAPAALQMPYPYPSLQYVPFLNGYAFPCVVPYWPAGAGVGAAEVVGHGGERTTLHQPVASRSFRPFESNRSVSDVGFSNGCQLEENGSKNSRKTGSSGSSPVCSSSVISDNYHSSSSHEGGGSSYTRSNSCNSSSNRHQMLCSNSKPKPNPNPNLNLNDSVIDRPSLNHIKPKPCIDNNRTQCEEKLVESHVSRTTTIKKEPIIMASNKDEVVMPMPMPTTSKSVINPLKSSSMKNMKTMENGKPPKPHQIQTRNAVPDLQQMPCVSTTGVGPNGKTITGFLYRYSNLEVSILCVCHGESFTPAEFIKHAGGGEVSHPLRHITVLPSTIR